MFEVGDHVAKHLHTDNDVPDQLTAIGVAEFTAGIDFVDLSQIMQECSEGQEVGVDSFVAWTDQLAHFHQVNRVS